MSASKVFCRLIAIRKLSALVARARSLSPLPLSAAADASAAARFCSSYATRRFKCTLFSSARRASSVAVCASAPRNSCRARSSASCSRFIASRLSLIRSIAPSTLSSRGPPPSSSSCPSRQSNSSPMARTAELVGSSGCEMRASCAWTLLAASRAATAASTAAVADCTAMDRLSAATPTIPGVDAIDELHSDHGVSELARCGALAGGVDGPALSAGAAPLAGGEVCPSEMTSGRHSIESTGATPSIRVTGSGELFACATSGTSSLGAPPRAARNAASRAFICATPSLPSTAAPPPPSSTSTAAA
mmetsp:Transcript_387/g.918  ORF Transcript_387/g.918 Transcript_387/m.918 type:complete len:304 (+) Transcript_387:709-1620(+)